jgi:hypothetical protein
MKGASDAEKYVAVHIAANEYLARMGAHSSDSNTIYGLLCSLPSSGLWLMISKGIETEIQCNSQQLITVQCAQFSMLTV